MNADELDGKLYRLAVDTIRTSPTPDNHYGLLGLLIEFGRRVAGGDWNVGLDKDVLLLVRNQQIIDAIKHVRAVKGIGLKEAKDYVDDIRSKNGL